MKQKLVLIFGLSAAMAGLGAVATPIVNWANVAITGGTISGITDLAVADGGTGSSMASGARTNLGITEGTWTPTWTSVNNVVAFSGGLGRYVRVGDTVIVWTIVDVDPSTTGSTSWRMSLPVAIDFSNDYDLSGTASDLVPTINEGDIGTRADTSNNEALFEGYRPTNGNIRYAVVVVYKVV